MARPRVVSVGTSATRLCVKNSHRKGLTIQNLDDTTSLFLGGATVSANNGIELQPKQMICWNINDYDRTYAWHGIVSSGSINVLVNEVY